MGKRRATASQSETGGHAAPGEPRAGRPGPAARSYRGVRRLNSGPGGYLAALRAGGLRFSLGRWPDARSAAIAVDRAALYFALPNHSLNLPRHSRARGPASPQELRRLARLECKRQASAGRYLNVWWDSKAEGYMTTLCTHGKRYRIGTYASAKAAAIAYDRLARHCLGKKAVLNFPEQKHRAASIQQLKRERRQARAPTLASRYRGVRKYGPELTRPWRATIYSKHDSRDLHLGYWRTEQQAAQAYDRAALHYFGQRAELNFPTRAASLKPADARTLSAESRQQYKQTTSSRFHGVTWVEQRGKYAAQLTVDDRSHWIGAFDDDVAAARAYDRAALRLLGPGACLNFGPTAGTRARAAPRAATRRARARATGRGTKPTTR
jgi:hypothetical protein